MPALVPGSFQSESARRYGVATERTSEKKSMRRSGKLDLLNAFHQLHGNSSAVCRRTVALRKHGAVQLESSEKSGDVLIVVDTAIRYSLFARILTTITVTSQSSAAQRAHGSPRRRLAHRLAVMAIHVRRLKAIESASLVSRLKGSAGPRRTCIRTVRFLGNFHRSMIYSTSCTGWPI